VPLTLVYCEDAPDRSGALRRERAIKQFTRAEKEALVATGRGQGD
jgi:predicted GIY-YIG superfamily endonuclease